MNKISFGILIFFTYGAIASETTPQMLRCSPGEGGPRPLHDIGPINSDVTLLKTEGAISEFTLSPSNRSIFYRNDSSLLYRMDVQKGTNHFLSTSSGGAISQLMDSSGRYLMQQEFGWAFDLGLGGWIHFLNAPQKITHLFWHTDWLKRDWIYSITPTPDANATYHVYRSEAYPYSGYELCTVKNVKLASGHEFPHVFFYHTKKSEKGPMLSLWELDVRTCKVAMRSEFKDPIVGNVLAVHRLEPLNSIAVAVDHPRKNLLWYQASKGCNYYESGGLLPMVPSRNFPVIAVWSSNKGLGLIFPDDEKRASVLGGAAIEELRSQDIALSNTGKELFISARPNGETFKLLLSVKIN